MPEPLAAAEQRQPGFGCISVLGCADILGSEETFPDLRLFNRVPKAIRALFGRLCEPPSRIARSLRKGITRFVTNRRLDGARMMKQVLDANIQGLLSSDRIVVAHDTSENDKHGRGVPRDAGPLRSSQARGYLIHLAVAVSLTGKMFGAVNAFAWTRGWKLRNGDHASRPRHKRESAKWDASIHRTQKRLHQAGFRGEVFHTEDSEADDYSHFEIQKNAGHKVITRRDMAGRDRFAKAAKSAIDKRGRPITRWLPLETKLAALPFRESYEVEVDSRTKDRARGVMHAVRTATIHFRFCSVTLKPPKRYRGKANAGLEMWIVEAKERNPPPDVVPLHWQLFATFPVENDKMALFVISAYKLRWKVEDYIKIAKSGCQLEDQHVDSLASFKRLAALSLAAANQLVTIVAASREESSRPISAVIEKPLLDAVRDAADYHRVRMADASEITIPGLLDTVARIGGFETSKGRVAGWLVLTRGWMRVLEHQSIVTHYARLKKLRPPSA